VNLLTEAGADAVFIFNFAFPSTPVSEGAFDLDRATFGIVKTFGPKDPRSQKMPPWAPKEAFHRLAAVYRRQAESIKTVMR